MKKIIAILCGAFLATGISVAQKFAYIDSEYILNNIPAYKAAQAKLDELSKGWEKEIKDKYDEVDKMYKDFQAEKVLLSQEMQNKREEEIIKLEKDAKELQKKYFGQNGLLSKKREELVKPIQEEIYNKVKELATEGSYSVIFDTSAGLTMLYADPKLDKSDVILEKLGYKN